MSGSPYPRDYDHDVKYSGSGSQDDDDDEEAASAPSDIVGQNSASVDGLKRWRQAVLVLNASRRFRCSLDLKKKKEKKQIIAKIRTHARVIRAAHLFQAVRAQSNVAGTPEFPPSPIPMVDSDIGPEQLTSVTRDQDFSALQNYEGVEVLSDMLNPEKGVHGDEADIFQRKIVIGSNMYTGKMGQSFWSFLFDACDTTLIILMVAVAAAAAASSLARRIKTVGIKEGWYDGGSIALALIIVIVVTAQKMKRRAGINQ